MDQNDPSRLRYNDLAGSGQQQHSGDQFNAPVTPSRLAQPTYAPQQQLAPGQDIARAGSNNPQLYGFTQGLQYGGTQQYGQGFVGQDPARSQQYAHYGPDMAYGMSQTPSSSTSHLQSGPIQQYRPRDSATFETMSGQFAEQQAAQYYAGAQPGPSTARQTGYGPPPMVSRYQSTTYAGAQLPPPSFAMIDTMHQTTFETVGQQQLSLPSPQSFPQTQQGQIDQGFARYQGNVSRVFTLVRNRTLREVSQPLLDASRFLLGNIEALGLHLDQESQHQRRLTMWGEFNQAWLTTMQCQFDMTQELMSGRSIHAPHSTMDHETLDILARELVRMCDVIAKHGLVDYQMGVEEAAIMEIILPCLKQLEPDSDDQQPELMEQ